MSWYRRHCSPENVENLEEEVATEKEKLAETKPSLSPPEEAVTKPKQDDKMDESTSMPAQGRARRPMERFRTCVGCSFRTQPYYGCASGTTVRAVVLGSYRRVPKGTSVSQNMSSGTTAARAVLPLDQIMPVSELQ